MFFVSSSVWCGEKNFIIGSWVSSKEETIKYNEVRASWTESQFKLFNDILGKLKIKITGSNIEWSYDGENDSYKYVVEEITKDRITIRPIIEKKDLDYFGLGDIESKVTFHKQGKFIYTEPKSSKSLSREYFERVEQ